MIGAVWVVELFCVVNELPSLLGAYTALSYSAREAGTNVYKRFGELAEAAVGIAVKERYFVITIDRAVAIPLKDLPAADHAK
jgi:hypothetical protein